MFHLVLDEFLLSVHDIIETFLISDSYITRLEPTFWGNGVLRR